MDVYMAYYKISMVVLGVIPFNMLKQSAFLNFFLVAPTSKDGSKILNKTNKLLLPQNYPPKSWPFS